jgi:Zn-dependent M28 family amino/carboxypeptidase
MKPVQLLRIFWLFVIALLLAVTLAACVSQPFVIPVTSPHAEVSADTLRRHVRVLAEEHHPRSVDDLRALHAAGDYVLAELHAAGASPEIQAFDVQGVAHRNFIARFGPAEGAVLVVGAHYDACGQTPGADDNASGVAGLLELARLLAKAPPKQPVELVAYTLEEPPYFRTEHMGSFQHARALAQSGREVRLMLSLEMIGYFRDTPASQRFPVGGLGLIYPDTGNFIAVVGAYGNFGAMRRVKALFLGASDLPVETINAPRNVPGVDFSDHASYWQRGMPAVMVTDTAFLRNPNYHQPTDTPDTLDYERMAKVVRAVYAVAMRY